jgi:hypothetical protein
VFLKFLLRPNFIESDLARAYAIASVCDPAMFQNFLNLAIFTKRPVDGNKSEIDIARQLEVFVADIYFNHFGA